MKQLKLTLFLIFIALTACATPAPTTTPLPGTTTAMPVLPTATVAPPTATATATPRQKTGEADAWLGKAGEREALFNSYVQTIRDGHVISELGMKRLGITWQKEVERTKNRFIEADTKADVYYALLSLQRTLHDAHSSLSAPKEIIPGNNPISLPFTLAVQGDSLENAHYAVIQSSLPEIKTGFVLKQYQNKTIAQLEYEYSEWLDSTSPESLKQNLARALTRHTDASRVPAPDASAPVTAVFVDPGGKAETRITFKWSRAGRETLSDDYARLTVDYRGINYRAYKDTGNNTLILVYSSFKYVFRDDELKNIISQASFIVPSFDKTKPLEEQREWMNKLLEANGYPDLSRLRSYPFTALLEEADVLTLGKYLNQQTLPNLLIDVRDNTGGNVNTNLVALFASQPFQGSTRELIYNPMIRSDSKFLQEALTYSDRFMAPIITAQLARDTEVARSQRFPFSCRTASCNVDEATFEPNSNVKKFTLAVLSGHRCTSACDQFVAMIGDNGLGKIVGVPSRGGSAPYRATKEMVLKNGERFSIIFNTGVCYRPNGEPLEGNPAKVEYYLLPEDDYINKMIEYLKQGYFK